VRGSRPGAATATASGDARDQWSIRPPTVSTPMPSAFTDAVVDGWVSVDMGWTPEGGGDRVRLAEGGARSASRHTDALARAGAPPSPAAHGSYPVSRLARGRGRNQRRPERTSAAPRTSPAVVNVRADSSIRPRAPGTPKHEHLVFERDTSGPVFETTLLDRSRRLAGLALIPDQHPLRRHNPPRSAGDGSNAQRRRSPSAWFRTSPTRVSPGDVVPVRPAGSAAC
jgi:hypothetical protein